MIIKTPSTPRTAFHQEGEDDENMILMHTTICCKDKVSSFLCILFSYFENRLLPNELIIVRNHGDDEDEVGG